MLNSWDWSRRALKRCHHFRYHSSCSKHKDRIRNLVLLLCCGALLVFLIYLYKRPKQICVKKVFNALNLNNLAKEDPIEKGERSIKQQIITYENSWKSFVFKRKQAILEFGHIYKENPWSMNGERTFWDFWQPHFDCPHVSERVGRIGKGGKWICGITHLAKKPTPCIVYSFGTGTSDLSFVEEILDRTDCQIFIYDPSNQNTSLINQLQKDLLKNPQRLHFKKIGIGPKNTITRSGFKLDTLGSLMESNGHSFIDILNLDIDGAEYHTLNQIMDEFPEGFPFGQLQVEFHIFADIYSESNNHISYVATEKTIVRGREIFKEFSEFWKKLEKAGLRPFHSEPNLLGFAFGWRYIPCYDYSFINIRVDNYLLRPS